MTKWLTQAWIDDALRHHLGGDLIDDQRLAFHLVAHGVEELLGLAVLDDLNGEEEAEAAHVADATGALP